MREKIKGNIKEKLETQPNREMRPSQTDIIIKSWLTFLIVRVSMYSREVFYVVDDGFFCFWFFFFLDEEY